MGRVPRNAPDPLIGLFWSYLCSCTNQGGGGHSAGGTSVLVNCFFFSILCPPFIAAVLEMEYDCD